MAKVLPEAKEDIRFFPCETKLCPHIHGNWSGYCAECARKSCLPPGTLKRLKIAGRKARLLFITLVMSFLETEDKVLLALFGWTGVALTLTLTTTLTLTLTLTFTLTLT